MPLSFTFRNFKQSLQLFAFKHKQQTISRVCLRLKRHVFQLKRAFVCYRNANCKRGSYFGRNGHVLIWKIAYRYFIYTVQNVLDHIKVCILFCLLKSICIYSVYFPCHNITLEPLFHSSQSQLASSQRVLSNKGIIGIPIKILLLPALWGHKQVRYTAWKIPSSV